ncbi:MAG: type II toxin-antitoxin system VapC family toxin [Candidatus Delongbacteria bacterium]|nr:type II toxin-antitoxin system VapC family toxin [Candidatus Delongbacteria bacterium]MCG2760510.1 type II toxin-antitoxin system VapC family toxin [Candidatus Delongbacteria bacterium]
MNIQKIYIDTSVIGGCFDKEFKLWSNSLIEDIKNGIFIPVLSEVVGSEIESAPERIKLKYFEILQHNSIFLELTDEAVMLAKEYQKRGILPEKFFEDGLHIALATINKVDLLVSWNFKHIVRFDKIRLFNAVNLEMGYKTIEIYSPMEVTNA